MAINTMGAPVFAPVRQDSEVIRTQAEYEAQRAAMERAAREKALKARAKAREASGYNEFANRYKNAPSTLEIQYYTGANSDQANRIRRYGDWENYTPEGGWGQKSLQEIQEERIAGEWEPGNGGSFEWKWSEPETPGQIVPYYTDDGKGGLMQPSWVMMSGSGENGTVLGVGYDKDRFYQEAMGRGVGAEGLNNFARQLGANDWNSLDWDKQVKQYDGAWGGGKWGDGTYLGYDNTYRGDPGRWGGTYAAIGEGFKTPSLVGPDGSATSMIDMPGSPWALSSAKQKWLQAGQDYGRALGGIGAMNADFASNMAGRNENQLRNQQGYSSLLGNGLFGGLLNDDYSNQFFGQITGREAPQSVFTTTQQGPYPWSTPSQQLDVSSLLSPGYGGPSGGGTMGSYGRVGGLGGLGGAQTGQSPWGGVFGAKNPWSPA